LLNRANKYGMYLTYTSLKSQSHIRTVTETTNPRLGVETKEVRNCSLATALYRKQHYIGVSDLDMY
jgi:hypothetical protein